MDHTNQSLTSRYRGGGGGGGGLFKGQIVFSADFTTTIFIRLLQQNLVVLKRLQEVYGLFYVWHWNAYYGRHKL